MINLDGLYQNSMGILYFKEFYGFILNGYIFLGVKLGIYWAVFSSVFFVVSCGFLHYSVILAICCGVQFVMSTGRNPQETSIIPQETTRNCRKPQAWGKLSACAWGLLWKLPIFWTSAVLELMQNWHGLVWSSSCLQFLAVFQRALGNFKKPQGHHKETTSCGVLVVSKQCPVGSWLYVVKACPDGDNNHHIISLAAY